jgi:hypothetical protein
LRIATSITSATRNSDRVAELDRVDDELALLRVDHRVLDGDAGQREQLLLGHGHALCPTLAGDDHVGRADEQPREPAQRREQRDRLRQRDNGQRGALGGKQRVRLGDGLGEHEDHEQLDEERDDDARRLPPLVDEHRHDRRRAEVAGQQHEQHRVEHPFALVEYAHEGTGALLAVLDQRRGARPAEVGERGLGDRQHRSEGDESHERRQAEDLRCAHAGFL